MSSMENKFNLPGRIMPGVTAIALAEIVEVVIAEESCCVVPLGSSTSVFDSESDFLTEKVVTVLVRETLAPIHGQIAQYSCLHDFRYPISMPPCFMPCFIDNHPRSKLTKETFDPIHKLGRVNH